MYIYCECDVICTVAYSTYMVHVVCISVHLSTDVAEFHIWKFLYGV